MLLSTVHCPCRTSRKRSCCWRCGWWPTQTASSCAATPARPSRAASASGAPGLCCAALRCAVAWSVLGRQQGGSLGRGRRRRQGPDGIESLVCALCLPHPLLQVYRCQAAVLPGAARGRRAQGGPRGGCGRGADARHCHAACQLSHTQVSRVADGYSAGWLTGRPVWLLPHLPVVKQ